MNPQDPIEALITYLRASQQYLQQLIHDPAAMYQWPTMPQYPQPTAPSRPAESYDGPTYEGEQTRPYDSGASRTERPLATQPLTVDPFRRSLYKATPGAEGRTARTSGSSSYGRPTSGSSDSSSGDGSSSGGNSASAQSVGLGRPDPEDKQLRYRGPKRTDGGQYSDPTLREEEPVPGVGPIPGVSRQHLFELPHVKGDDLALTGGPSLARGLTAGLARSQTGRQQLDGTSRDAALRRHSR